MQNNLNFNDIRESLSENEAAIEFIAFQYDLADYRNDSVVYAAFIITKTNNNPIYVPLCDNNSLKTLLKLQGLTGRGAKLISNTKIKESNMALFTKIWEPLEIYLTNIKYIYIAPDGLINRVVFACLLDKNQKILFDKYEFHYLLCTKDIIKQKSSVINSTISSITLFGGANYNSINEDIIKDSILGYRSLPSDLRGENLWNYLPNTLTEVKNISNILSRNLWHVTCDTGNQASEINFKLLSGKNAPTIIHIATHGFYFPLMQTSNSIKTASTKFVYQEKENPMLRSGLVFSSANISWTGKTVNRNFEDGILTAYEFANINLQRTELVVLSACETGVGDVLDGEGVFGLQRAIKEAGVDKMIVSLWSVPDKETAEMMEEFYFALSKGSNYFKAFLNAQSIMRNRYVNEPLFWAGFVLIE